MDKLCKGWLRFNCVHDVELLNCLIERTKGLFTKPETVQDAPTVQEVTTVQQLNNSTKVCRQSKC
jgi:hypothetical protein